VFLPRAAGGQVPGGVVGHRTLDAAENLRRTLQDCDPAIRAQLVRTDLDALDLGTALEIVLAAPAIIELAKGISSWLGRTHSGRVTVTDAQGAIIVENITARDAAGLAEKLRSGRG
jgi:hypothetical protein